MYGHSAYRPADQAEVAVAGEAAARWRASGCRRRSRRRRRCGPGRCAARRPGSTTNFRPETQSLSPAGNGRDLGRRGRGHAVAEVDHRHGHPLGGDDPAPGRGTCRRSTTWLPCRRRGCSRRTAARSSVCGRMNWTLTVLPSGWETNSSVLDLEALGRARRPRCRTHLEHGHHLLAQGDGLGAVEPPRAAPRGSVDVGLARRTASAAEDRLDPRDRCVGRRRACSLGPPRQGAHATYARCEPALGSSRRCPVAWDVRGDATRSGVGSRRIRGPRRRLLSPMS